MIELIVVELLEMEEEGEKGSAGSVEHERRDTKLVGHIHHGNAEHVDDEPSKRWGVRSSVRGGVEVSDGGGNVLFLRLDEGVEEEGVFGAVGNGLFREGGESDPVGSRGGTEGLDQRGGFGGEREFDYENGD